MSPGQLAEDETLVQHSPGCADGFETVITDSRGHGICTFNQKGNSEKVMANAQLIIDAVSAFCAEASSIQPKGGMR